MAIQKKLLHFNNFSTFNGKKLSANDRNTTYTLGVDGEKQNGNPDILYQSIVFIKDTLQIWTHGELYDANANGKVLSAGLSELNETINEIEQVLAASISDIKQNSVGTDTTINGHKLNGDIILDKSDIGLGNVGNFKAVSTAAGQGLSTTEKSNARTNIGAVSLGETSSTAYRGDRGKIAYDHSQATHARTDATKVEGSETNGNILIDGTETTVYTHPGGTNPHGTTKNDVGLGNVDNTSDLDKPLSTAAIEANKTLSSGIAQVAEDLNTTGEVLAAAVAELKAGSIGSTEAENPTLTWGQTSKVGTINGVGFNVTMPGNPNTNYYTTNLGVSKTATTNTLTVSGNNSAVQGIGILESATSTNAGLMSSADKIKFDAGELDYYVASPSGTVGSKNTRSLWTGTVDTVSALYTGLKVLYKIPVAGASAGVVLNINNLGDHPVAINANTKVTTHYPVGAIVPLVYDADQATTIVVNKVSTSITGTWKIPNYDSNTTYTVVANTYVQNLRLKVAETTHQYQVLVTKDPETLVPVSNGADTNTGKTMTSQEFDPFGGIYIYNATAAVNAGSVIAASSAYQQMAVNLKYAFNLDSALTSFKTVYLVCTLQESGKFKLHSTPISQALPNTEDSLYYIKLGVAYGDYTIAMEIPHPVYYYKAGQLRLFTNALDETKTLTASISELREEMERNEAALTAVINELKSEIEKLKNA